MLTYYKHFNQRQKKWVELSLYKVLVKFKYNIFFLIRKKNNFFALSYITSAINGFIVHYRNYLYSILCGQRQAHLVVSIQMKFNPSEVLPFLPLCVLSPPIHSVDELLLGLPFNLLYEHLIFLVTTLSMADSLLIITFCIFFQCLCTWGYICFHSIQIEAIRCFPCIYCIKLKQFLEMNHVKWRLFF